MLWSEHGYSASLIKFYVGGFVLQGAVFARPILQSETTVIRKYTAE